MLAISSSSLFVRATSVFRQQRSLSSYSKSPSASPPLPPLPLSSGAAQLSNRHLVYLWGHDAPKFLHGLITNNLHREPDAALGLYTAFLSAQGRLLNDAFIYPTLGSWWQKEQAGSEDEPGFLIEVDVAQAPQLVKYLKVYKLRSKVQMRLLEDNELDVWSVWREGERPAADGQPLGAGTGIIGLTDRRAPDMGERLLLPEKAARELLGEVQHAPLAAYTVRRYLRGVPEGQSELPPQICLPLNSNIDLMGGIDFKKGCYPGQELTIRTHHTGVVRRRILPVMLYDRSAWPPEKQTYDPSLAVENAEMGHANIRTDDTKARKTGVFIAGMGNMGLATCTLDKMSDLPVDGQPSLITSETRFYVENEQGHTIGLKSFVPDWLREKIPAPKIQRRVE